MIRTWKYLANELKIAPQRTIWERFKIRFVIFMFCSVLTGTILFIATLITSAIASNAEISGYISPALLGALTFPTLLPIVLMGLSFYVFFYPFFEALYMGKRSQDGAMEFQRWLENHIIDRFSPPWSIFFALGIFVVLYIVPPFVITAILSLTGPVQMILIFLDWFMIMPMAYLSYYATIGSSQAWFAGLRANLRRDRKRLIYFVFSIFMILSTVANLFIYLPYLLGIKPLEPSIPGEAEGIGGFIQTVIEFFLNRAPPGTVNMVAWNKFIRIVPLDFLFFFVVTCLFGILGFYAKFLNKEPLNRPILVLFAAYMVCGISFQMFSYMMTKWPWAFPGLGLDIVDLHDSNIIGLMYLFLPAVSLDKVITAIFLIYQLFFNKSLKETIEESVLTQAISDKDIKVLKKYSKNKHPRIRVLVADAVVHIISSKSEIELEKFIPIFEDLIVDHDPNVLKAISPAIKLVGLKVNFEKLYSTIQLGFGTEEDVTVSEMQKILIDIGKVYPERIESLYTFLYQGYVPDKVKDSLMEILHSLAILYPELSYNIGFPLLDRKTLSIRQGGMILIKNLIHDFRQKFPQIYDKMREIAFNKNEALRDWAIEIMAYISSMDNHYVERFLVDYKSLEHMTEQSKEKIVGGLTQIIISFPEYLDQILPKIYEYLTNEKSGIKQDIIMSLGVISIQLTPEMYLAKIHPRFEVLYAERDERSKIGSINTFKFLFKARTDLFSLEPVKELLIDYLRDDSSLIRTETASVLRNLDTEIAYELYFRALKTSEKPETLTDLLQSLDSLLEINNYKTTNDLMLDKISSVLLSLNNDIPKVRTLTVKIVCNLFMNSLENVKVVEKTFPYLQSVIQGNIDEASAIVMKFFGKITLCMHNEPKMYSIDFKIEEFHKSVMQIAKDSNSPKHLTRDTAIENLAELYLVDGSKHAEIFNLFYSLRDEKDANIRAVLIKTMTQIACDFQEIYFKTYQKEIESRWIEQSRLEEQLLPILNQNFTSPDENVRKELSNAISLITDTYGSSTIIKDFLFKMMKKKRKVGINEKGNVIDCLTRLQNAQYDFEIIKMINSLTNDSDKLIREMALRALTNILLKHKPIEEYNIDTEKEQIKAFKMLSRAILRRRYLKDDEVSVRLKFIEVATDIAIKFPNLVIPMLFIKDYVMDSNQDVAIASVKSYFKYISIYPNKLEETAHYMRIFANSMDPIVKSILLKQLIMNYKSGKELKFYLPTLLKLALDKDKNIRQRSLQIFKQIYEKTQEKLLYFMELLIRLTRDKDSRIRNDAFELVAQLTFEFPQSVQQQNLVFETFSRISRDYDINVKITVSGYLENMIKIFPEKLNSTLNMIYNLLREKDRNIIQNCVNGLKYVLILYPERRKEILSIISRFYRRTANPALQQLLQDVETIKR
jgi:hypothetical protein